MEAWDKFSIINFQFSMNFQISFFTPRIRKILLENKARRALKIYVLWWGPNRQVGALWIVNLASRDLYFLKILSSRGGFFPARR